MTTDHYLPLGGAGPIAQIAPANGFPPEAYRPLAAALAARFRVVGYRPRPLWPGSRPDSMRTWHDLAGDLIADMGRLVALVDELPATAAPHAPRPILGIGHSLGGIMTLYAALARPELFRGVALLDPVILPRRLLPLVWAARGLGFERRAPLAQGAIRRRDRFASHAEAHRHYSGRSLFSRFAPEALSGYLEGGLRESGEGVTLAWPRDWEAHIFARVPIDTWDAVARLRVPLLLIRGRHSDLIIDRSWRELQRRLPQARLVELDAGHMVPMEQPAAAAETILQWAEKL